MHLRVAYGSSVPWKGRRQERRFGIAMGTSLMKTSAPPLGPLRALGIVLLKGPRGALFPMSEVALYCPTACALRRVWYKAACVRACASVRIPGRMPGA